MNIVRFAFKRDRQTDRQTETEKHILTCTPGLKETTALIALNVSRTKLEINLLY